MPDSLGWVVAVVNIVVMLIGFATVRREQKRDAAATIEKATTTEHRITVIETHLVQIMHKLGMHVRD